MGRGPARLVRGRWLPIGLAFLVLLSGSFAPVLQDEAARAMAARLVERAGGEVGRVNRLPAAALMAQQSPPAPSGAHPPYPLNHTFDGESYAAGTPPDNHGFEAAPETVGTPATNHDFAAGNLSGWEPPTGTVSYQTGGGGNGYARFGSGGKLVSAAFDVAADAQLLSLQVMGESAFSDQYRVYVLFDPTFSTSTLLTSGIAADGAWATVSVSAAPWRGETIKVRFEQFLGTVGMDTAGVQTVALVDWATTGTVSRLTGGGPDGWFAEATGDLTSTEFALPADAQNLSFRYKAGQAGASFNAYLLYGAGFASTVNLTGGNVAGSTTTWQTWTAGVVGLAGQTVKLRFSGSLWRNQYDLAGVGEAAVPGWTTPTRWGVTYGSDANGSYATPTTATGSLVLYSSPVSPGWVDVSGPDFRYYSVTYDFGYSTGSLFQVFWHEDATTQWTVFQDGANSPTGLRTRWFWLSDVLSDQGWFEVKLTGGGKVYQLGDNVARQQLGEPYSLKAGHQVDTTTGAFGTSAVDLRLYDPLMPVSYARYYNGHADRVGTMGWRWSHTFDVQLVITPEGDGGVTFGSGKEEFFDWRNPLGQGLAFYPTDPRIKSTLTKNLDGSYAYRTVDNLTYHFTPGAVFSHIEDLRGNQIVVTRDGQGRVDLVTDPGGRTLDFVYDGNGRLWRVIDPEGGTVTYGYDANGDLTTVTDPDDGVTTYTYSRHRLTSITDPNSDLVVEQTLDPFNRVVTQTDALDHDLAFAYGTPGVGATRVTDPLGHATDYHFDAWGRTTDVVDPEGLVRRFLYDGDGNLEKWIDPAGHQTDADFDAAGQPTEVTDPVGNPTLIEYNGLHLPTEVTDARENTWLYEYDLDGNKTKETDPLGQETGWTYDAYGNALTMTVDPGSSPHLNLTTEYGYDGAGNLTSLTDPLDHTWSWTYDGNGRMTSRTNPLEQTWSYDYSFRGLLIDVEDPLGNVTRFNYDGAERLIKVTSPLGMATTSDPTDFVTGWTYDERGFVATKTDPAGNVWIYEHDDAGNLVSLTDPLDQETLYEYDDADRLIAVTDPLSRVTEYGHDALGRRTAETVYDPTPRTTTYAFDGNSRLTSVTLPSGRATAYGYDGRDLLTSVVVDPGAGNLNLTTGYAYDDAGQLVSETNPRNYATEYAYDDAGRLTTITDALTETVEFGYDAAGRVVSETNARGMVTSFTHDELGNVLSETDPENRTRSNTYDLLGRLDVATDARGYTADHGYDARGDLTSVVARDPSSATVETVGYAYDELGRLEQQTDATGTTGWTYDDAGRITAVASPQGTVGYGYDAANQRTSMILPGSRTTGYAFDDAGRLESLTDWRSETTTFGYDADGNRTSVVRPNGVSTAYAYDDAGRLGLVEHADGGTMLQRFVYTLDANGNRTQVVHNGGTETYELDALDRVTEATYPNGDVVEYAYDPNGNRTELTVNSVVEATYTYDDADQLLSDGSIAYVHDSNGNLTAAGADTFQWDWADRMSSATVGSQTTTYAYAADGARASRTNGTTTTEFLWDRLDPSGLPMLVDDGTQGYLHAGGVLVGIDGSDDGTYPLADGVGSVRGRTDDAGAVVGTADYDAFGVPEASTGVGGTFGFAGEQRDPETGQLHLRARQYAPGLGRFTARDSVIPNYDGTQGYNPYAYGANNPTTLGDPSGRFPIAIPIGIGLAALALFVIYVLLYLIWYLQCYTFGECFDFDFDFDFDWPKPDGGGGGGGGGGWRREAEECVREASFGVTMAAVGALAGSPMDPLADLGGAVVDCIDGINSPKADGPSGGSGKGKGGNGDGDDGGGGTKKDPDWWKNKGLRKPGPDTYKEIIRNNPECSGRNAGEMSKIFHRIKDGKPTDDFFVDPKNGDVYGPDGEFIDNMVDYC